MYYLIFYSIRCFWNLRPDETLDDFDVKRLLHTLFEMLLPKIKWTRQNYDIGRDLRLIQNGSENFPIVLKNEPQIPCLCKSDSAVILIGGHIMFILFRDATLQINCVTTKLMFDGTNCRGPTNAAASLDICWAGILKINSEIWTGLHLQHIHVNFYPPKGEFLSEFQIKEKEK